jgi:hypothetical protein
LPLAPTVKYTENGQTVQVGQGFWQTAGAARAKRTAVDTETCSTVTESVVAEGSANIVLGLRLKSANQQITEIESIIVRSGDYFSNPQNIINTQSDDWETVLPADQRPTREALRELVDNYFNRFPGGACNFAPTDCIRYENGFTPGACGLGLTCSTSGGIGMQTRLHVLDVEAGIAVGFTMFAGAYTDFHMFRVRNGQVTGLRAVLARASSPGW